MTSRHSSNASSASSWDKSSSASQRSPAAGLLWDSPPDSKPPRSTYPTMSNRDARPYHIAPPNIPVEVEEDHSLPPSTSPHSGRPKLKALRKERSSSQRHPPQYTETDATPSSTPAASERSDRDAFLNQNFLERKINVPASVPAQRSTSHQKPVANSRPVTSKTPFRKRLVIGLDYGTTFTGVAYTNVDADKADIGDIHVVDVWGEQMGNADKIPSVISYSPASVDGNEQQWGSSLSADAVAMVNTKLELDVQDNKIDELDLILQALNGMADLDIEHVKLARGLPDYTWKGPEDIVTDYLTKIFQYLDDAQDWGKYLKSTTPVDIVITVPVKWSYRAKNSTFRAVRNAGFNEKSFANLRDVIMVTEPEAAAIYTARYLKNKAEQEKTGQDFLKLGECFVLCDAGGGTADVVTYKITQLEPTLEFERVTLPTGAKCGSTFIDANFKQWLNDLLGDANYSKLDPRNASQMISSHSVEGGCMRTIMNRFDPLKRKFTGNSRDMPIDLPAPLDRLEIPGKVRQGCIKITSDDMRMFFDPCVDQIVELIQGQIHQVERKGSRVKTIYLIGGFGESVYLQEELRFSVGLRKIKLQRPDTSWSAVSRGATIYGVEKATYKNLTILKTCPRSYGIMLNHTYSGARHNSEDRYTDNITNRVMANGQLTWLMKKGDLLLSEEPRSVEREFAFNFREQDKKKLKVPVFEYSYDDIPDRFQGAQEELTEVAMLNCDFSNLPLYEFDRLTVSGDALKIEILWNEKVMDSTTVTDIQKATVK